MKTTHPPVEAIPPVARLPGPAGDVAVAFEPLCVRHSTWWHEHVQSQIDSDAPRRADRGWRWPRFCQLQGLSTPLRSVRGTCLTVRSEAHSDSVPIGICLLVTPHPHLTDPTLESVFVWFLTSMPSFVAQREKLTLPGLIGSALLDFALSRALEGNQGRVCLHSAMGGGAQLAQWYGAQRLMKPVSETLSLPGILGVRLPNDGRYFSYETPENLQALSLMAQWR